jgi:glycosyltransferase involved in cell wall biosynthesis
MTRYNAERYVGEAIGSALGQTYGAVEVVVVNDGSTGGSLEVTGMRVRVKMLQNFSLRVSNKCRL